MQIRKTDHTDTNNRLADTHTARSGDTEDRGRSTPFGDQDSSHAVLQRSTATVFPSEISMVPPSLSLYWILYASPNTALRGTAPYKPASPNASAPVPPYAAKYRSTTGEDWVRMPLKRRWFSLSSNPPAICSPKRCIPGKIA